MAAQGVTLKSKVAPFSGPSALFEVYGRHLGGGYKGTGAKSTQSSGRSRGRKEQKRRPTSRLVSSSSPPDWVLGLGMHLFRQFEREGASKSLHVHKPKWFGSGGLLSRERTTLKTKKSKGRALGLSPRKQNCYVKRPHQRQRATCSSRIGSVPLFLVSKPRPPKVRRRIAYCAKKADRETLFERARKRGFKGDFDYFCYILTSHGGRRRIGLMIKENGVVRPSSCINTLFVPPTPRAIRLCGKFVRRFITHRDENPIKLPQWLRRIRGWEVLVYINYRRASRSGLLKWWSTKREQIMIANGITPFTSSSEKERKSRQSMSLSELEKSRTPEERHASMLRFLETKVKENLRYGMKVAQPWIDDLAKCKAEWSKQGESSSDPAQTSDDAVVSIDTSAEVNQDLGPDPGPNWDFGYSI